MAEMIEIRKSLLWPLERIPVPLKGPSPRPVRYLIDPTAFAAAVIAAPLLITALTFWMWFVPVIALVLGGPVYLLCVVPVLMWDLPRQEPTFGRLALMGFLAAMVCAALMLAASVVIQDQGVLMLAGLYAVMGAIFGPLWGGTVAPLYKKFRRADYARAIA